MHFFWGCRWAFFLLQPEQGIGSCRPVSRGRRGRAVSPSVSCRLWPPREEALRAESGLGLLSGQDSGHIRGRLNLLGNRDNVDGDKLFPSLYELVQFSNSPKTNTRI